MRRSTSFYISSMKHLPLLALFLPALAFAQGALTPAAAPAASMKRLDQIEARCPVQAGAPGVTGSPTTGFTISAAGSYYLTGDITVASGNAITITASPVTLDLNGFTLSSTANPATGYAIKGGLARIANGRIQCAGTASATGFSGPGFAFGISLSSGSVTRVSVAGISGTGIGGADLVAHSSTREAGTGISAGIVAACTASACRTTGIASTIAVGNTADTFGQGINASIVADTTATSSGGAAITGTVVRSSIGLADSGYGIDAKVVHTSTGRSRVSSAGTGATGLRTDIAYNCHGTTASPNAYGIRANYVAFNSTSANTAGGLGLLVDNGPAVFCRATISNASGDTAISAPLAIGCTVSGLPAGMSGVDTPADMKFLGTP
jgi:hypothetical protein